MGLWSIHACTISINKCYVNGLCKLTMIIAHHRYDSGDIATLGVSSSTILLLILVTEMGVAINLCLPKLWDTVNCRLRERCHYGRLPLHYSDGQEHKHIQSKVAMKKYERSSLSNIETTIRYRDSMLPLLYSLYIVQPSP